LNDLLQLLDESKLQLESLQGRIETMLDISRINAGQFTIKREEFDLVELVHAVLKKYTVEFKENNCNVSFDLEPKVIGYWDWLRVEQVLTNLLSNATKYGRGKPVEISLTQTPHHAVLTVGDHGIGMSSDDQLKIFERFERKVSIREFGGFGLGLYIAREIVLAHGGTISVKSSPNEGASFTICLPKQQR
jgi:signal transduction histidine kinase